PRAWDATAVTRMGRHARQRSHVFALSLGVNRLPRSGHRRHCRRCYPAGQIRNPEDRMTQPVVDIKNLSVTFRGPGQTAIEAVKNVSMTLTPGRALGIVGESGSGKSVTARSLLGL